MASRSYQPDSLEEAMAIMDERAEDEARVVELAPLDTRIDALPLHPLAMLTDDTTVHEAAELMSEGHLGVIGVVRDGAFVGIFTERDVVMRVVSKGLAPTDVRLRDVMTPRPESLRVDDSLAYLAYEMQVRGHCHVPVCEIDGSVRGVCSMRDLLAYLLEPVERRISTLPPAPYHGEHRLDVEYG